MRNYITYITVAFFTSVMLVSCDPKSPETSDSDFLASAHPMTPWVNGIDKEMALAIGTYAELLDVATDNYRNVYSRSNREFDKPNIRYTDSDVENLQRYVGKLREMSTYALTTIAPVDAPSDAQLKSIYTALAMSYILAGENFTALPMVENGQPEQWSKHLQKAIEVLGEAKEKVKAADFIPVCHTLLARAYYRLGDKEKAKENAMVALQADNAFCATVRFDETNGVVSTIKDRTFSANWWEPLPRLDFLDPKFQDAAATQNVAYAKAEEDYLILAECCAADAAELAEFKNGMLQQLFSLIESRGVNTFVDDLEMREAVATTGVKVNLNTSDWKVKASATDEAKSGLVLNRKSGEIHVPAVSGTSLSLSEVRNAQGDDFLELLYLLRQEIFFAEGRRFADLGMRLPLCEVEAAKVKRRYPGMDITSCVEAFIPSFIPSEEYGLDNYTVDEANKVVTITHNMNREIVKNKHLDCVVPFE